MNVLKITILCFLHVLKLLKLAWIPTEKKKIYPFDKNFSWKNINKDNYKDFCNNDYKSFFIITGKISNITVKDFDDETFYNELVKKSQILKIILQ